MSVFVIDGKGHLMGRLASICAKELLEGKKLVIVRCEKIEKTGKHIKSKFELISRSKKRTHTNPRHGPFHFKSPSQVFWKTVRGMLPHKTFKGSDALMRLKLYDGIPMSLIKVKKFIIPYALRNIRLAPGRKFANLGEILEDIGWKRKSYVEEKDEKLRTLGKQFWKKKFDKICKSTENIRKQPYLQSLN
jgi:large subunit ribosomal protein L13Ae